MSRRTGPSPGNGRSNWNVTHGEARRGKRSPTYNSWASMIQRCANPKCENYPNYGGRGIKVCPEWRDFACFLLDMGEKPTSMHTIDRVDNNGDYEPGNC